MALSSLAGLDLTHTRRVRGATTGIAVVAQLGIREKSMISAKNAKDAWAEGDPRDVQSAVENAPPGRARGTSIVVVLWEPPLLQSQSEAMPGNRAIPTAAASIRCSAWWRKRTRVRRTDRRAATAPHAPNQFSALTPVGRLKPC